MSVTVSVNTRDQLAAAILAAVDDGPVTITFLSPTGTLTTYRFNHSVQPKHRLTEARAKSIVRRIRRCDAKVWQ